MSTKITEEVNQAYAELEKLEKEAYALINRDRYKESEELIPAIQDARSKLHMLRNKSADGQPWGDLFDIESIPVWKLLNTVARHLSSKQVTVNIGNTENCKCGECNYLADGSAVIVLDENNSGEESRFLTYLHEIAHAKFDGIRNLEPEEVRLGREERANLQAKEWNKFAESNKHYFGTARSMRDAERKLRALLLFKK